MIRFPALRQGGLGCHLRHHFSEVEGPLAFIYFLQILQSKSLAATNRIKQKFKVGKIDSAWLSDTTEMESYTYQS